MNQRAILAAALSIAGTAPAGIPRIKVTGPGHLEFHA